MGEKKAASCAFWKRLRERRECTEALPPANEAMTGWETSLTGAVFVSHGRNDRVRIYEEY